MNISAEIDRILEQRANAKAQKEIQAAEEYRLELLDLIDKARDLITSSSAEKLLDAGVIKHYFVGYGFEIYRTEIRGLFFGTSTVELILTVDGGLSWNYGDYNSDNFKDAREEGIVGDIRDKNVTQKFLRMDLRNKTIKSNLKEIIKKLS